MTEDERSIRNLVENWQAATIGGEHQRVLELVTDDVVFLVPGAEPFGKERFSAALGAMKDVSFEGKTDIQEIRVIGDWAFLRTHIDISVTPAGASPARRSGHTLTILTKDTDGRWRIARDANLLTVADETS